MPSVIILLFIALLRYHSWAGPVPEELSELFDLDPESISKASLDPDVYLNSMSSSSTESDLIWFETSGQTNDLLAFDDSGLEAGANDNCPIGQSRKRNGETCPATGLVEFPSFGIFGDYNEEELDSAAKLNSQGRNENICSELLFFFGRVFDVCCNGPFGPFVIDSDVRLIYSWISDCRLGMSKPYVIASVCLHAWKW